MSQSRIEQSSPWRILDMARCLTKPKSVQSSTSKTGKAQTKSKISQKLDTFITIINLLHNCLEKCPLSQKISSKRPCWGFDFQKLQGRKPNPHCRMWHLVAHISKVENWEIHFIYHMHPPHFQWTDIQSMNVNDLWLFHSHSFSTSDELHESHWISKSKRAMAPRWWPSNSWT